MQLFSILTSKEDTNFATLKLELIDSTRSVIIEMIELIALKWQLRFEMIELIAFKRQLKIEMIELIALKRQLKIEMIELIDRSLKEIIQIKTQAYMIGCSNQVEVPYPIIQSEFRNLNSNSKGKSSQTSKTWYA